MMGIITEIQPDGRCQGIFVHDEICQATINQPLVGPKPKTIFETKPHLIKLPFSK